MAAMASDHNGDPPSSNGAVVMMHDVEPSEQVGHQSRRKGPGLTGDHRRAEVDSLGLGPAHRREQPSRRRCDGDQESLGHWTLDSPVAEAEIGRDRCDGPEPGQDRPARRSRPA